MKTLFKTLIILLVLLTAASCTQYRFFPFPLPEEDDSTPYDVTTAEDFSEMLNTTGQARLTSNISISILPVETNGRYNIDLNGNTLTLNASAVTDRLVISEDAKLVINGNGGTFSISIPSESSSSTACIKLEPNSSLTLNNVTYRSEKTGILVDQTAAELNINNSTIIAEGGYAVGTNASNAVEGIKININNSYLYADNGTGLLFNIPSSLNIVKSHIEGGAQALIVRNGTATITDSKLVSIGKADATEYAKYNNNPWGEGNMVPLATLVVGNRGDDAYDTQETSCTVTNTSITKQNNTGMDVYVASDNNNTVTFTSPQYAHAVASDPNHYHEEIGSTLNIRTSEGSASLV